MFADWVRDNESRFAAILAPGERLVGEWLAQAHGTRYDLKHEPLVVFDLMTAHDRVTLRELRARVEPSAFITSYLVHEGEPVTVAQILPYLTTWGHGALDPVEGAVWRVERHGKVDFLAKWVRPDKEDGSYLPEISGEEAVWNWRPT
jgi:hypothetical protein